MKNKLMKSMTHIMLITTGFGFVAPLAQPMSVFAEEKVETKSETTDLTKAIDEAKAAGVSVNVGETKVFQSRTDFDAYVKDTIAKLKDASTKASELKKAQGAKNEAYNVAMTKYNQEKADYEKKLKSYTEGLAKFQKDQQNLTKRNDILANQDGIVVYGKYDEANKGSVKYFGQIGIGLADYNKYPNLSFVKDGDYIGYHEDSAITDVKVKKASYDKSNSGDRTWLTANDYSKGDSFKLTNVATTTDGAKLDMIVTFKEDFKPILTEPGINDQSFGNFAFWKYNQDGAINVDARNSDNIDLDFKFVDQKTGKPVELLTANIESDLDNYQSSLLEYSTIKSAITLIPQGSESELKNGAVVSKFNDSVDNTKAIPKGSFVSIGIGDTIHHQFRPNMTLDRARLADYLRITWNQSKATGDIEIYKKSGYTYQLFGKSASVNLNVFKEKKPTTPVAPTPVKSSGDEIKIDVADARLVITKHIDITTGKEISKQEDGKQPKKDIPGYEFVETKDEGGNTIHYYKPVEKPTEKVITKHIDITTGKEISKQEDGKQPKKDIPGYEFVETKDEGGNTIHYYKPVEKPAEKVITKHIDITTGKEISKQEDGKQPKKDILGYEFVETKDEGGNTIHYYKPVEKPAEKVITKHIDITTGKEISKQEDGKQPKKDIPGYEFVETKDEGGNTIHYYKPVEKKETPKELPKTSEQAKQRNTAIVVLLSVVGLGGLATYLGLRKRDEK